MTNREARRLLRRISEKANWIDEAVNLLEKLVSSKQNEYAQEFLAIMIEQLEVEEGYLNYSNKNRKVLQRIDKIMAGIRASTFNDVLQKMISNVQHIISENVVYYGSITPDKKFFKATSDQVKEIVFNRLGFDKAGNLIRDGYMQGLFDAPEVGQKIKEYVHQSTVSRSGFESFRKGLRTLIEGKPDQMGIFERFYRNYAYDTYSQIDSLQSKLLAEDLKLKYFIYNGGLIKTSRKFCIRKNGRVFSTEDAKGWADEPDNNAKPPNYDPLIHRGGYGCRHPLDYISEEMANALGYGHSVEEKKEIYSRPLEKQFDKLYDSPSGGKISVHKLVDKFKEDYKDVFDAAKLFADQGAKVQMPPEIHMSEISVRNRIYPGLDSKTSNPDLIVDGVYIDLKRVQALDNITTNANKANHQGASALISDKHVDLTDINIERASARIFSNKNTNKGIPNYNQDQIYYIQNGKIIKINRPKK